MKQKIKNAKQARRLRTKLKVRRKIQGSDDKPRVSIFRSSKHIYAQVISDESGKTLISASTLQKSVQDEISSLAKSEDFKEKPSSSKSGIAAHAVGKIIAAALKEKGIEQAVFDRGGFKYQGRVKAVAEGIRLGGFKI